MVSDAVQVVDEFVHMLKMLASVTSRVVEL